MDKSVTEMTDKENTQEKEKRSSLVSLFPSDGQRSPLDEMMKVVTGDFIEETSRSPEKDWREKAGDLFHKKKQTKPQKTRQEARGEMRGDIFNDTAKQKGNATQAISSFKRFAEAATGRNFSRNTVATALSSFWLLGLDASLTAHARAKGLDNETNKSYSIALAVWLIEDREGENILHAFYDWLPVEKRLSAYDILAKVYIDRIIENAKRDANKQARIAGITITALKDEYRSRLRAEKPLKGEPLPKGQSKGEFEVILRNFETVNSLPLKTTQTGTVTLKKDGNTQIANALLIGGDLSYRHLLIKPAAYQAGFNNPELANGWRAFTKEDLAGEFMKKVNKATEKDGEITKPGPFEHIVKSFEELFHKEYKIFNPKLAAGEELAEGEFTWVKVRNCDFFETGFIRNGQEVQGWAFNPASESYLNFCKEYDAHRHKDVVKREWFVGALNASKLDFYGFVLQRAVVRGEFSNNYNRVWLYKAGNESKTLDTLFNSIEGWIDVSLITGRALTSEERRQDNKQREFTKNALTHLELSGDFVVKVISDHKKKIIGFEIKRVKLSGRRYKISDELKKLLRKDGEVWLYNKPRKPGLFSVWGWLDAHSLAKAPKSAIEANKAWAALVDGELKEYEKQGYKIDRKFEDGWGLVGFSFVCPKKPIEQESKKPT